MNIILSHTFFTLFDNMFVGNKKERRTPLSTFASLVEYTKKLAKDATFLIWVYLSLIFFPVFMFPCFISKIKIIYFIPTGPGGELYTPLGELLKNDKRV